MPRYVEIFGIRLGLLTLKVTPPQSFSASGIANCFCRKTFLRELSLSFEPTTEANLHKWLNFKILPFSGLVAASPPMLTGEHETS